MLSHVDLCSGIGGFALGFQWAGLSKPVLFCDIEPWSRKVLAKHWPDVPIAEDVKELANDPDGLIPRTDPKRTILTAGYPCQPFSHAGKRLGHEDDRHIWPYLLQIVAQKRPAWCCFENVYGHVSMGLDQVLLDLEGQGYATRPFIVPACAVDAPHRRDRLWIIAHTFDADRRRGEVREPSGNGEPTLHGEERDVANTEVMHSNVSAKHTEQGQRQEPQFRDSSCEVTVAHTDNKGLQGQERQGQTRAQGAPSRHVAKRGGDVAHTDSPRCKEQRRFQSAQPKHQAPQCGSWWLPEPSVGRVANGIPKRVDRLRGLGNAIVPQIAQKIGEAIKASIDA